MDNAKIREVIAVAASTTGRIRFKLFLGDDDGLRLLNETLLDPQVFQLINCDSFDNLKIIIRERWTENRNPFIFLKFLDPVSAFHFCALSLAPHMEYAEVDNGDMESYLEQRKAFQKRRDEIITSFKLRIHHYLWEPLSYFDYKDLLERGECLPILVNIGQGDLLDCGFTDLEDLRQALAKMEEVWERKITITLTIGHNPTTASLSLKLNNF